MTSDLPSNCSVLDLPVRGDARGSLIAIEGGIGVPFAIARVYYIFGTKIGVTRGLHAHVELEQLALCVSGSCTFVLDDGTQRTRVRLDRPDLALRIGPFVWREMQDFTDDCVLLVLASQPYCPDDYIADYDAFLELVEQRRIAG